MTPYNNSVLFVTSCIVLSLTNPTKLEFAVCADHVVAATFFLNWELALSTGFGFVEVPHHGPVVVFEVATEFIPFLNVFTLDWEVVFLMAMWWAAETEWLICAAFDLLLNHALTFLNIAIAVFFRTFSDCLAQVNHLLFVSIQVSLSLVFWDML